MNDKQRAALMAAITSTLNALVLAGIVHMQAEALGGINLAIGNFVVLVALIFPSKSSTETTSPAV